MKKLVILGGGAAGFMVAVRLRRSKISDMDVVLVDNKVKKKEKKHHELTVVLLGILWIYTSTMLSLVWKDWRGISETLYGYHLWLWDYLEKDECEVCTWKCSGPKG